MGQNREQRDMGRGRNEAETGEPIQLNEKDKDQRAGQHQAGQQGGGQQQQGGGQHGGGQQPNRPQAKPDDKQQKPA